jgi:hypothetical protein
VWDFTDRSFESAKALAVAQYGRLPGSGELAHLLLKSPAGSAPGWPGKPTGDVDIDALAAYGSDRAKGLAFLRNYGVRRGAITNWTVNRETVLLMIYKVDDTASASKLVDTVTMTSMTARGAISSAVAKGVWFVDDSPDQPLIHCEYYFASDDLVGRLSWWSYTDRDCTDGTALAVAQYRRLP